ESSTRNDLKGEKTWDHGDNPVEDQPKEITVNLYADGKKVESKKVTAAEDWKYDFGPQPKYGNGKEIKYTVDEEDIPNYDKVITGFNIKNTYNPGAPHLVSTKTDNLSRAKVEIGDTFKYSITVKNIGKVDAKDVEISDRVPSKLDILNVTPKEAKISGQLVEYTVPEIKAEESFTMTIEVKVNKTARDGDRIKNVAVVDGKDVPSREIVVDEDDGYLYIPSIKLNKDDHYAYMIGYPDDTFRPQGNITRAEVTTIFFRMMTDESRNNYWSTTNDFGDVQSTDWFNNAISTMSNAGGVNGYPDGTFRPNANITRGEFATMASRFLVDSGSLTNYQFTDTKGNWAEDAINKLASNGLISGYPDGSFKPDQQITRAEAATLMNAVLERTPHKDNLLSNMKRWVDNTDTSEWYYAQVQEATNSHTYTRTSKTDKEVWQDLLPIRDWAAFEKEWSGANSASSPGSVTK
ncbi:S-layer homology domain-containing protein, partial [Anaerosphaera multitolerans]